MGRERDRGGKRAGNMATSPHMPSCINFTHVDVEGPGLVQVHKVVVEGERVLHVVPRAEAVARGGVPLCRLLAVGVGDGMDG